MKTVKLLKITSVLQLIFCIFCISSTLCFAISRYYHSVLFFSIGIILTHIWIINPVAIISFLVCLVLFLNERKQPEAMKIIGKKWIWIFVWPVITTFLYITAGALAVAFTGGV